MEAPTRQGNVVDAPIWHNNKQVMMDNNPELERGQCEVCLEGGNQHTCNADESMNIDTSGDEEEVGMLVLNREDIEVVDKEVDEPRD